MTSVARGNLNFASSSRIERTTTSGQVIVVYDCLPPPRGSRNKSNPETLWPISAVGEYLQDSEVSRIVAGADPSGATGFADLFTGVCKELGYKALDIDLSNVPPDWNQPTPCYTTTIAYVVECDVFEMDVRASTTVTLGGETYATGDSVASFRVSVPVRYKFIRWFERNYECCTLKHPTPPEGAPSSDWYPVEERDISLSNPGIIIGTVEAKLKFSHDYADPPYDPNAEERERYRAAVEELQRHIKTLADLIGRLSGTGQ